MTDDRSSERVSGDTAVERDYEARLTARQSVLAARERTHVGLSRLRLVLAAVFIALILIVGDKDPWAYGAVVIAFAAAVVVHGRVLDARARARRAVAFYERGLERLRHEWMGKGDAGERYRSVDHPYADDLDLFGTGSLFEFVGTARTNAGQDVLASWLLEPAVPEEAVARQAAVKELVPRLDLREALSLEGDVAAAADRLGTLRAWATAPPRLQSQTVRVVLAATALSIVALVLVAATTLELSLEMRRALVALVVTQGAIVLWLRPRVRAVLGAVTLPVGQLSLLAGVLRTIEPEGFTSPRLARIAEALGRHARRPSIEIARLERLVALLESRKNLFFAPVAAALAWTTQIAFAMEAWRMRVGPDVLGWIDAAGEFEALASMATYAAEHPGHVFPTFETPPAAIAAAELAHPLLGADAVANDVTIGGSGPHVLIVSGSNMSGKSTFLRSIGTAVVMAQAGLPVRARAFRLAPMATGASIRIVDSLQEGRSRFFAEIRRLKAIVEIARAHPGAMLFLLDEILGGTNSHDRQIGAEAVVAGLAGLGAIGLVTTHDLAIGEVVDRLPVEAVNVHFADELDADGLRFDYRLRPGVVRTSNALALMRSIGLDVGEGGREG